MSLEDFRDGGKMKRPEMILFDYGNTLLYEPDFDMLRGEKAVFQHVTENPNHVMPEQSYALGNKIFSKQRESRMAGVETHEWHGLKLQYEYLGIKFDIPYDEVERVLWENASPGACMPQVKEMLAVLRKMGIRSGVISNIGWSGKALTQRINRLLPNNEFEFIIASSEYCFRKPDPLLFELALKKAGLQGDQVWYCGDSIQADVYGAHSAGIFPVLIEDRTVENPWLAQNEGVSVDFDYLRISGWDEMIELLERLPEEKR